MYLVFDTETTGLPRNFKAPLTDFDNWPRIVQLAWNLYDSDAVLWGKYSYIIKPQDFIIPEEVAKIHRISQERAEQEGIPLEQAMKFFLKDVEEAEFLVAHNIEFDEKIISAELLRLGWKNPLMTSKKICTMKSSAQYCQIDNGRGSYKWPNLNELYRILFKKDFVDAHDAAVDVKACADCLFELKRRKVILL